MCPSGSPSVSPCVSLLWLRLTGEKSFSPLCVPRPGARCLPAVCLPAVFPLWSAEAKGNLRKILISALRPASRGSLSSRCLPAVFPLWSAEAKANLRKILRSGLRPASRGSLSSRCVVWSRLISMLISIVVVDASSPHNLLITRSVVL